MYMQAEKYPCTRILEENWKAILAEYQEIAGDKGMHAWPEDKLYDGRWDTYGLYAFGKKRHKFCERCPVTKLLCLNRESATFPAGRSLLRTWTPSISTRLSQASLWLERGLRCHRSKVADGDTEAISPRLIQCAGLIASGGDHAP